MKNLYAVCLIASPLDPISSLSLLLHQGSGFFLVALSALKWISGLAPGQPLTSATKILYSKLS